MEAKYSASGLSYESIPNEVSQAVSSHAPSRSSSHHPLHESTTEAQPRSASMPIPIIPIPTRLSMKEMSKTYTHLDAQKAGVVFRRWDADGDGRWNFEEAREAVAATEGKVLDRRDYEGLCAAWATPPTEGLTESHIVQQYAADSSTLERDYNIAASAAASIKSVAKTNTPLAVATTPPIPHTSGQYSIAESEKSVKSVVNINTPEVTPLVDTSFTTPYTASALGDTERLRAELASLSERNLSVPSSVPHNSVAPSVGEDQPRLVQSMEWQGTLEEGEGEGLVATARSVVLPVGEESGVSFATPYDMKTTVRSEGVEGVEEEAEVPLASVGMQSFDSSTEEIAAKMGPSLVSVVSDISKEMQSLAQSMGTTSIATSATLRSGGGGGGGGAFKVPSAASLRSCNTMDTAPIVSVMSEAVEVKSVGEVKEVVLTAKEVQTATPRTPSSVISQASAEWRSVATASTVVPEGVVGIPRISLVADLQGLVDMHQKGRITAEEFSAAKTRLLHGAQPLQLQQDHVVQNVTHSLLGVPVPDAVWVDRREGNETKEVVSEVTTMVSVNSEAKTAGSDYSPDAVGAQSTSHSRDHMLRYRKRLMNFFHHYRPEKLPSVMPTVRGAATVEDTVFAALERKYGPEPKIDYMTAPLRHGWQELHSRSDDVYYEHFSGQKQWTRPIETSL